MFICHTPGLVAEAVCVRPDGGIGSAFEFPAASKFVWIVGFPKLQRMVGLSTDSHVWLLDTSMTPPRPVVHPFQFRASSMHPACITLADAIVVPDPDTGCMTCLSALDLSIRWRNDIEMDGHALLEASAITVKQGKCGDGYYRRTVIVNQHTGCTTAVHPHAPPKACHIGAGVFVSLCTLPSYAPGFLVSTPTDSWICPIPIAELSYNTTLHSVSGIRAIPRAAGHFCVIWDGTKIDILSCSLVYKRVVCVSGRHTEVCTDIDGPSRLYNEEPSNGFSYVSTPRTAVLVQTDRLPLETTVFTLHETYAPNSTHILRALVRR